MFKKSVSNLYLFKSRQHNDNSYVKRKTITSVTYFISWITVGYWQAVTAGHCGRRWRNMMCLFWKDTYWNIYYFIFLSI